MSADVKGTFINFRSVGASPSGKTSIWAVDTRDGLPLGTVKWFGAWRKYAFYPADSTVFEATCLMEIAAFCMTRTEEHKARR